MVEKAFFLTVIPGLETAAYLELCDKWRRSPDFFSYSETPNVNIVKGGLEFIAPLHLGLQLNRFLKIPTRILLREAEFDCPKEKSFRDQAKLIKWSQYFKQGSKFDLSWSSKGSRLSMKKQMVQLLEDVLKPLNVKYEKGAQSIYIRLVEDKCNISFDSTGERAQFRGVEKKVSMASLRESTAAGLLRILLQGMSDDYILIDPMCGSGTFLTESLCIDDPTKRKYSFESYPVLRKGNSREVVVNKLRQNLKKVYGYDNHQKAVDLVKRNLSSYKSTRWSIENKDLFKDEYAFTEDCKRVVVLNPPWGKRLPAASKDFVEYVDQKMKPDRLGILIPAFWKIGSCSMEKVRDIPILNSGVENRFLVFVRP